MAKYGHNVDATIIGREISSRFSLPRSCSTIVNAKRNAVPGPRLATL